MNEALLDHPKTTVDTYKEPYLELLVVDNTRVPKTIVVDSSAGNTVIGEVVGPRRYKGRPTERSIVSHAGDIPYELGKTLDDEEAMDLIIHEWEVSLTEG